MTNDLKELKKTIETGNSFKDLKKSLDDSSPYLKWVPVTTSEGDALKGKFIPIEGILVGYEEKKATYTNDGVDKAQTVWNLSITQGGRKRILTASQRLMKSLVAEIDSFDVKIRITRSGEQFDTSYKVEKID